MDLVLVHPEIPYNSGSTARLCAALGLRLHFVEPLGFSLEDRYLKRAGLDYWPMVDLVVHSDWEATKRALDVEGTRPFDERLRLFSARGGTSLFDTAFESDDILCLGGESRGLPPELLEAFPKQRVYIPIQPGIRSLNLASVACLSAYTAMISAGMALPENDGTYSAHPSASKGVRPEHIARR